MQDSRIHFESASCNAEIVVAAAESCSTNLGYLQPASFRSVLERNMLEQHHAVGKTVELKVALRRGLVVEQQHRAVTSHEELLDRKNLPAKPERFARQQSHFGKGVENNSLRIEFLHDFENSIDGLLKLDLGRM